MHEAFEGQYIVTCELSDAAAMAVLIEGCRAHSDLDAFPLELDALTAGTIQAAMPPETATLEALWMCFFPSRESIECFMELMATVDFKEPDYIRFVDVESNPDIMLIWNMTEFHRFVFHES